MPGLIDGWITCGQAFGGELEAVTVWTGMLAAKEVLGADVIVVADGPGNLGTDTTWGVSALGSGNALNAAAALGGRPIPSCGQLRRPTGAASGRLASLAHDPARRLPGAHGRARARAGGRRPSATRIWDALRAAKLEERHQLVEVDGRPALDELAARGIEPRSMGRGVDDDPRASWPRARRVSSRAGSRKATGAGVPKATPSPASRRSRSEMPPSDPLPHAHEIQVADARPDEDEADVDDRQEHPQHAAHRPPGAPAGARRGPADPAGQRQEREHRVDPDRQPDDETDRPVVRLDRVSRVGSWGELVARHHMWAISCSTRSSTLRNGSLHSTVRCAWSFSFRCTQSTV